VIEIDGALDIANDLGYIKMTGFSKLGEAMISWFKLLTGLIQSGSKH